MFEKLSSVRVVLYAMVIPSVKLIALILAEIWRDSEVTGSPKCCIELQCRRLTRTPGKSRDLSASSRLELPFPTFLVPCPPACLHDTCSLVRTQVVQIISKWACPDMFAYILLLLPDLNELLMAVCA